MEKSTEKNTVTATATAKSRENDTWNRWDAYVTGLQFIKDSHGIK